MSECKPVVKCEGIQILSRIKPLTQYEILWMIVNSDLSPVIKILLRRFNTDYYNKNPRILLMVYNFSDKCCHPFTTVNGITFLVRDLEDWLSTQLNDACTAGHAEARSVLYNFDCAHLIDVTKKEDVHYTKRHHYSTSTTSTTGLSDDSGDLYKQRNFKITKFEGIQYNMTRVRKKWKKQNSSLSETEIQGKKNNPLDLTGSQEQIKHEDHMVIDSTNTLRSNPLPDSQDRFASLPYLESGDVPSPFTDVQQILSKKLIQQELIRMMIVSVFLIIILAFIILTYPVTITRVAVVF